MPEPIFPGCYRPPTLPKGLIRRARRRAHELAMEAYRIAYGRYVIEMFEQLDAGALKSANDVENWRPLAG